MLTSADCLPEKFIFLMATISLVDACLACICVYVSIYYEKMIMSVTCNYYVKDRGKRVRGRERAPIITQPVD